LTVSVAGTATGNDAAWIQQALNLAMRPNDDNIRTQARRHRICPATVQKWRYLTRTADAAKQQASNFFEAASDGADGRR
jgi:hypothetical protein